MRDDFDTLYRALLAAERYREIAEAVDDWTALRRAEQECRDLEEQLCELEAREARAYEREVISDYWASR